MAETQPAPKPNPDRDTQHKQGDNKPGDMNKLNERTGERPGSERENPTRIRE